MFFGFTVIHSHCQACWKMAITVMYSVRIQSDERCHYLQEVTGIFGPGSFRPPVVSVWVV